MPKRRVKAKLRDGRCNATRPERDLGDGLHDQLATGRKLRVLTIVDTFSRFPPASEPRFTFRGTDVVEVLERAGREVGLPATIRVDQSTEFVSGELDLWAYQRGVTLDFSRPGKPTGNAFIEAFNGRFREKLCANASPISCSSALCCLSSSERCTSVVMFFPALFHRVSTPFAHSIETSRTVVQSSMA